MSYSLDRIIWQYRDKPRVRALIDLSLREFNGIDEGMADLKTRLNISLSVGVQLDGIGDIVGRPRPLTEQIDPDDTFAFAGPDTAGGFSGIGREDEGGRFVGVDGLIVGAMSDENYRRLLRTTIEANNGNSGLDHIYRTLSLFVGSTVQVEVLEGVGFVDVTIDRNLPTITQDLMREVTPVAAGVTIRNITVV